MSMQHELGSVPVRCMSDKELFSKQKSMIEFINDAESKQPSFWENLIGPSEARKQELLILKTRLLKCGSDLRKVNVELERRALRKRVSQHVDKDIRTSDTQFSINEFVTPAERKRLIAEKAVRDYFELNPVSDDIRVCCPPDKRHSNWSHFKIAWNEWRSSFTLDETGFHGSAEVARSNSRRNLSSAVYGEVVHDFQFATGGNPNRRWLGAKSVDELQSLRARRNADANAIESIPESSRNDYMRSVYYGAIADVQSIDKELWARG